MKFDVKIKYEEEYLPTKRHRIPRIREVEEMVEAELREVARKDAPVAMVATKYQWFVDANGKDDFGLRDTKFLAVDGELYREKRDRSGALDRGAYSTVQFKRDMERAGDVYYCKHYSDYGKSREDVLRSLRDFMGSHVMIDGVIHRKSGEPRYVVNTFGLGHNHGSTGMFIDTFYNENIGAKNYFNALQRDEAIAYATEVATRRGDTNSLGKFGDINIEVYMPEMVRCNPEKEHGDGDPFLNSLEDLVQGSGSAVEAGILTMVFTGAEVAREKQVENVDRLIDNATLLSEGQKSGNDNAGKANDCRER